MSYRTSPCVIMGSESTATVPLPRHRILHQLRRERESYHREMMYRYAVNYPYLYEPDIKDLDHLAADMTLEQADHCCNKSVAVYVMSADPSLLPDLLLEVLHNYLYDRWFRPYRSELEYGQFLAKTIVPRPPSLPVGAGLSDVVDVIIPVHAAISSRAEEARLALKELDPNLPNDTLVDPKVPKKYWRGLRRSRSLSGIIRHQEFFIVQPLFRALAIVIRNESFGAEISDIGQLSVLVVRTGAEEGLSAPISFDPIAHKISSFACGSRGETAAETTLGTAVDFVMDLEKREVTAFGPRPDPVASTKDLEDGLFRGPIVLDQARRLGWGDEPLVGPSSRWVDPEKYPEWTGWSEYEVSL
ncbi:hypothetical protein QBC46DRAFT_396064 [Diplogelasinospora grovesii]|uniref:Uncharacterized protein n=1 Tax=Diplogelasinospora grovesii TaxID=303347 RepID=A0AAN6S0L4_9PEZI|nr:hypothetical protein QBC46DRAFT_396064 [Diplogelasinospora grovesii]